MCVFYYSSFIELKVTYYANHQFKFEVYVLSQNCAATIDFRTFSSSPKTLYPLAVTPHLLSAGTSQPLIYFLYINVSILGISYQWKHVIC